MLVASSDADRAAGCCTAAELERGDRRTARIDTVLVAFPDLQGRLVGKRVTGHYWAEQMQGGLEPVHTCNYLLAVDSRDERALRATSSRTGSRATATWRCSPTSRRSAASRGSTKTALVLCDLVDEETGAPVEVSPRRILQRQVERRGRAGYSMLFACGARVLPVPRVARRGGGQGLHEPHAALARDRGLPHPPDDARRVRDPRDPQRHRRRGRAGRVLEGRSRASGQHEINLAYADRGRDGRPPRHLQERRQGDRGAARPRRSRSWRSTRPTKSARRATCTRACGTPTGETPLMWDADAPDHLSPAFRGWLGGQIACGRELAWMYAPDRQLLQALPARVVGADRARVERRQPHVRLPRSSATARRSGSSRASPAPT